MVCCYFMTYFIQDLGWLLKQDTVGCKLRYENDVWEKCHFLPWPTYNLYPFLPMSLWPMSILDYVRTLLLSSPMGILEDKKVRLSQTHMLTNANIKLPNLSRGQNKFDDTALHFLWHLLKTSTMPRFLSAAYLKCQCESTSTFKSVNIFNVTNIQICKW